MSRNKSGYDAVVDGIMKLPEIEDMLKEWVTLCNDPRLVKYDFSVISDKAIGNFQFQFGPNPMTVMNYNEYTKKFLYPTFWLKQVFASIVEGNWGQRCKTYNCNREVAINKAYCHMKDERLPNIGNTPKSPLPDRLRNAPLMIIGKKRRTTSWKKRALTKSFM